MVPPLHVLYVLPSIFLCYIIIQLTNKESALSFAVTIPMHQYLDKQSITEYAHSLNEVQHSCNIYVIRLSQLR